MNSKLKFFAVFALIGVFLMIASFRDVKNTITTDQISLKDLFWKLTYVQNKSQPIIDNKAIYGDDQDDASVEKVYLLILPTDDSAGHPVTFTDLKAVNDQFQAKPILNARLLPSLPNDAVLSNALVLSDLEPNATITLRGQSSILSKEKSYKIRLTDSNETWHGSSSLNLNKHPFDNVRIRNKVAFDLMELLPDLTSLRTRFVRLFVKDLSVAGNAEFIDYGLYENIEQVGPQFLKDHLLDENGTLYKVNYNEFFRYKDAVKNVDDPAYDVNEFEYYFETKAGHSNKKLIAMLDDVNDMNLDIDQVFDKYFNRDNYFTWLAVNILLGNFDTQERNYFLYSPHDTTTWYFLPWDYDKSLVGDMAYDADGNLQQLVGIPNYWGVVLHSRMFKKAHNLAELNAKIEQIYKIFSADAISHIIDKYLPVAEQYCLADLLIYLNVDPATFYASIEKIRTIIKENRDEYYSTQEKPMPVFLGEVEKVEGGNLFNWTESYDLQGDRISYTLQIAKDPRFTEIVFERNRIGDTGYVTNLLPGDYYWRVNIIDSKGNTQRTFDDLHMPDMSHYFGLKKITIE